jgi:lysophospholipase L1-like esterase
MKKRRSTSRLAPIAAAGLAALAAAALLGAELWARRSDAGWRAASPLDPVWVSFLGVKRVFPPPATPDEPGVKRILCVGGSTTAGYPFPRAGYPEWLQLELTRCGAPGLRVLNRGVGSYGTLREPIVLAQELEARRPSIVVLNSGQNDYQELMLYRGIPYLLRGWPARLAASTALGTRLLRSLPRGEYHGPWQGPWGLPARLGKPHAAEVEQAFETRLRDMARAARAHGALPVICVTPVDLLFPPGDSEIVAFNRLPVPHETSRVWYRTFTRARELRAHGSPLQALKLLATLPPEARNPHLVWLTGACAHDAGDFARARTLLRESANRFLASERMREAQRRVASEEDAVLVDLEAAFAAGRPDGLPDPKYFSDGHHLSALGYRVQAREILRALAARGQAPSSCPARWDGRPDRMLQRDLGLDPSYDAVAYALLANAFVLYNMGSDNPWFTERAVEMLEAAIKADPGGRFLEHVRSDLPLVCGALAEAYRRAGDRGAAKAWQSRAGVPGGEGK